MGRCAPLYCVLTSSRRPPENGLDSLSQFQCLCCPPSVARGTPGSGGSGRVHTRRCRVDLRYRIGRRCGDPESRGKCGGCRRRHRVRAGCHAPQRRQYRRRRLHGHPLCGWACDDDRLSRKGAPARDAHDVPGRRRRDRSIADRARDGSRRAFRARCAGSRLRTSQVRQAALERCRPAGGGSRHEWFPSFERARREHQRRHATADDVASRRRLRRTANREAESGPKAIRFDLTDLGRALQAIAADPDAFYTGWIADSLAAQMAANGGIITQERPRGLSAVERAPLRGTFLGHEIIAMPPPSSGGVRDDRDVERDGAARHRQTGPRSARTISICDIETARRAYLDRARHLGDPDFVKVPVARLTSKAYAGPLARGHRHVACVVVRGVRQQTSSPIAREPRKRRISRWSTPRAMRSPTPTRWKGGYGSGVVVGGAGFMLNNEMGDFNKKPGETNTRGDIGTPAEPDRPGQAHAELDVSGHR